MEKQNREECKEAYRGRKVVGGIYAVRNMKTGKRLVSFTADLRGFRNRFEFARQTGNGLSLKLQKDWKEFGPEAFTLEILEELEKKEAQTPREFSQDLKELLDLRLEQENPETLY